MAADVGYGIAAFDTGLLTPYAGTVLADGADRTYRLGERNGPGGDPGRPAAGTRRAQPVNQGLRLQVE